MHKQLKIFLTGFIIFLTCFMFIKPAFCFDEEALRIYNEGMDFNYQEKYDDAISCFEEAIEIEPYFLDAYRNLAATYEQIGNNKKAIETYEILFSKNRSDYNTAYKLAFLYSNLDDKEKTGFYLKKIPKEDAHYKQAQELAMSLGIKPVPLSAQTAVQKTYKPKTKSITVKYEIKGFDGPAGITKDSKGNIYIADYSDNAIIQINSSGTKRVLFKDAPLNGPLGLAIDIFDNIYAANYNSNEILKISLKNNTINVIYKNLHRPYYLMIDTSGYLYVTEQESKSLSRFKIY